MRRCCWPAAPGVCAHCVRLGPSCGRAHAGGGPLWRAVLKKGDVIALTPSVFNQADDASNNRTGNATPERLAGETTDVDIVARPGHHRNERTKELTTTDTSDCASNRVAKRAQTNVLRCCACCIAQLHQQ